MNDNESIEIMFNDRKANMYWKMILIFCIVSATQGLSIHKNHHNFKLQSFHMRIDTIDTHKNKEWVD